MKKVNVFLMAALIAASAMCVVSCESDPSDPPSIKIEYNDGTTTQVLTVANPTIDVGSKEDLKETVSVALEFGAPGGIAEIIIRQTEPTNVNYSGYPKNSNFSDGANLHKETLTVERTTNEEQTFKFSLEVYDKDKNPQQDAARTLTIVFAEYDPTPPTTPLEAVLTHLIWSNTNTSTPNTSTNSFQATNALLGLTTTQLGGAASNQDPTRFTLTGSFVTLTQAEYDGLVTENTKESVRDKFEDTETKGTTLAINVSPAAQYQVVRFITKVGNDYLLVRSTVGSGNDPNTALPNPAPPNAPNTAPARWVVIEYRK